MDNSEQYHEWCDALQAPDKDKMELLIGLNFNVNIQTRNGFGEHNQTALQIAITQTADFLTDRAIWISIVDMLLTANADPMLGYGCTAIQTCLNCGCVETLPLLMEKCAYDINSGVHRFPNGGTLVMKAVERSDEIALCMLIEYGVDLFCVDQRNEGVLHVATDKNITEIILNHLKYEPNLKAFINLQNTDGNTPIHLACRRSNFRMCHELLKVNADVTSLNLLHETPLHELVKNGNSHNANHDTAQLTCLNMLLQRSVPVNKRNKEGDSCLHLAVRNGFSLLTTPLLSAGANVIQKDARGRTSFHLGVLGVTSAYELEALQTLLDHKTFRRHYLDIKDDDGFTPLLLAAQIRRISVINSLCEKGADVNSQDNEGNTAIILSTRANSYSIVEKSIRHGASIYTSNQAGETPWKIVTATDKVEVISTEWDDIGDDAKQYERHRKTHSVLIKWMSRIKEKAVHILMGSHERLGIQSILRGIPPDVLVNIACLSSVE